MFELEFDAIILQNGSMDAAYVEVPYDIRALSRWAVLLSVHRYLGATVL